MGDEIAIEKSGHYVKFETDIDIQECVIYEVLW